MMIEAAIPLGIDMRLLAARADDSAALVSPHVSVGPPTSYKALAAFAEGCDAITFDHELVDAALLRPLEHGGHFFPIVRGADYIAALLDWLGHHSP